MAENSYGIRFASATQIERIKQAANVRKWSFNQFVIEAADEVAKDVIIKSRIEKEQAAPVQQ